MNFDKLTLDLGLAAVESGLVDPADVLKYSAKVVADGKSLTDLLLADEVIDEAGKKRIEQMAGASKTLPLSPKPPASKSSPSADSTILDLEGQKLLYLATPETKGRYVIRDGKGESELGRGGLGRVLSLYDQHLCRQVAVKELLERKKQGKTLPLPGMDNPASPIDERIIRFLKEAKITGQLTHPSIVPVYEIGRRENGDYYYTMKRVKGETLSKALSKCNGYGDRMELLGRFEDLCQAIAYAHSRGVIHRDIKPSNVMLGRFGETVVLDWGLAKILEKGNGDPESDSEDALQEMPKLPYEEKGDASTTMDGSAVGTPNYMSPEQAIGAIEKIDRRSDVWALGVILYKILTGRLPYEADSQWQVIEKIRKDPLVPVRDINPEVPSDLAAVAEKALSRKRGDRYANAGEMAREIASFRSGARVRAYEYSSLELFRRFVSKNKGLSTAIAAILALLVVGSGIIYGAYKKADAARKVAQTNAVTANFNFALSLAEKAQHTFDAGDYLNACVFAGSSLLYNPYNPFSPNRINGSDQEPSPENSRKIAQSHSWYWQSMQEGVLEFQKELAGHGESVSEVAYSLDGKWIASVGNDPDVRLWKIDGLTLEAELKGHSSKVRTVAFSPDGKWLVSGSRDRSIIVWDLEKRAQFKILQDHQEDVRAVRFSSDGKLMASAAYDGTAMLWSTEDWKAVKVLKGHKGRVQSVVFTPNGRQLVTGSWDRTAIIWDVKSGKELDTLAYHENAILNVAVSPDGKFLALASWDETVTLWDLPQRKLLHQFTAHSQGIRNVVFSPDGSKLATASWDHTLRLWDVKQRKLIQSLYAHKKGVLTAAFSPSGDQILTAGADALIRAWSVAPHPAAAVVEMSPEVFQAADVHGKLGLLALGGLTGRAGIWNINKRQWVKVWPAHKGGVTCLDISPLGNLLVTGGGDKTLRVWDLKAGKLLHTLSLMDGPRAVSFSPDGKIIATGGDDKELHLWDSATGEPIRSWQVHDSLVMDIAFSPDGTLMATAGLENVAKVWDLQTGQAVKKFTADQHWPFTVAFSPDGKTLATAGRDKTIRIWGIESGQNLGAIQGHSDWVMDLAFSEDGSYLVSGSKDKSVCIWNPGTGALMQQFNLRGEISSVRVLGDGKKLAINDGESLRIYDTNLDFWKSDPKELVGKAIRAAGDMEKVGTPEQRI